MPSSKYLGFTLPEGATEAKKAVHLVLFSAFLVVLYIILASVGNKPYNAINQAEPEPSPVAGIVGIVLVLAMLGGCLGGPIYCAFKGLAGNPKTLKAWAACEGIIAFFGTIGFLFSTIMGSSTAYNCFCTELCLEQLKAGNSTCEHSVVPGCERGGGGGGGRGDPQAAVVAKEYCDSNGTVYQGAWFELTVGPILTIVGVLVSVVTIYFIIKKVMPEAKKTPGASAVTTVITQVTIVSNPGDSTTVSPETPQK